MVREVLSELLTFYPRSEGRNHMDISRKKIQAQKSNKYKGREARSCIDCSRDSNMVSANELERSDGGRWRDKI